MLLVAVIDRGYSSLAAGRPLYTNVIGIDGQILATYKANQDRT